MTKLSCMANVKRDVDGIRPEVPPDVVFASYVGDCSGSMVSQEKASADGVYEWEEMCSGVINNDQMDLLVSRFSIQMYLSEWTM